MKRKTERRLPLPRRVVNAREAAAYLGLCPSEFYERTAEPGFPEPFAYTKGGRPRYDLRALDEWIDERIARRLTPMEPKGAAIADGQAPAAEPEVRPEIQEAVRRLRA